MASALRNPAITGGDFVAQMKSYRKKRDQGKLGIPKNASPDSWTAPLMGKGQQGYDNNTYGPTSEYTKRTYDVRKK